MEPLFRWLLAGVLFVGSPFAAIGGWEALKTASELRRDIRCYGRVVENRVVTDQRDGLQEHAYVPVVEFLDTKGGKRRFTDPAGSLPPDYAVGESVEIAFDPSDPARARITSWKRLWFVPALLVTVGLLPASVRLPLVRRPSRVGTSGRMAEAQQTASLKCRSCAMKVARPYPNLRASR